MKIAVLSDIHANDIALKCVLNHAQNEEIEHFLVLGDIIGYYYWPDKVLSRLGNYSSIDLISGNHERMLKSIIDDRNNTDKIISLYGSGIERAFETLTMEQKDYLIKLPCERQLELDGCSVFMCHGSPFNKDEYVYKDSNPELLNKCALPDYEFVLMGHTHHPFYYKYRNTVVINPGSIGQPRDIGNSSSYVVLDTKTKKVKFCRVLFDINPVIKECIKYDPDNKYLVDVLKRNSAPGRIS